MSQQSHNSQDTILNPFDTSLGVLSGVELSFTASINQTYIFTGDGDPFTFTADTSGDVGAYILGAFGGGSGFSSESVITDDQQFAYYTFSGNSTGDVFSYDSGVLSYFTQGQTFGVSPQGGINVSFSGLPSDASFMPSPDGESAYASGTLTYFYALPEPATWAMLIAGFGLIGGALRTRRPQFAS